MVTPIVFRITSSNSAKPLSVKNCINSMKLIPSMKIGKRNLAFFNFSNKIPKNPKGTKSKIFPTILMVNCLKLSICKNIL